MERVLSLQRLSEHRELTINEPNPLSTISNVCSDATTQCSTESVQCKTFVNTESW